MMYKVLKYLAIVIGIIGVVLLARILVVGGDAIEASGDMQASYLDPFMWVSYLILAAVILLVAIFAIKGLFSGNVKTTLIALGSFIAIVLIAYLVTSGSEMELRGGDVLSANGSHWVSAGLVTFYILAGFAILTMVFSGIKKLIR